MPALSPPTYSDRSRKRLRPADVMVRAACAELLRQSNGDDLVFEKSSTRFRATMPAARHGLRPERVSPAACTTAGWAAELVARWCRISSLATWRG